jgi:cyanophycin synthetase
VTEASFDEASFADLGDVVRDERGVRFSRESDD